MNLSKYFTDKPLKKILEHHDALYKMREVAQSREEKLAALAKQVEMLNTMNEGGKVKLKIPQDFVSHFLDDKDIDDIWAATHINEGISDKATILGDMRQVWKIFTYLDFIDGKKKKKDDEEDAEKKDGIEKKDEKDDNEEKGNGKAEIENEDDGKDANRNEDEEKAEILDEKKDDDDDTPKGPYFTNSMAQSIALDGRSWNLNNIEDMLLERNFMANVILNNHGRRSGSPPMRRGRRRGGDGKGKGHAWSGIGGSAVRRFGRGISDLMFGGGMDFDLNKALMSLGAGGFMENDQMNDDGRSSSMPRIGSKSEKKLAQYEKKSKEKEKKKEQSSLNPSDPTEPTSPVSPRSPRSPRSPSPPPKPKPKKRPKLYLEKLGEAYIKPDGTGFGLAEWYDIEHNPKSKWLAYTVPPSDGSDYYTKDNDPLATGPSRSPTPPPAGKNRTQRRRHIQRVNGDTRKPTHKLVYENLKADGVHDSDYDSDHESDQEVVDDIENENPEQKTKNKNKNKNKKVSTPQTSESENEDSQSSHTSTKRRRKRSTSSDSGSGSDSGRSDSGSESEESPPPKTKTKSKTTSKTKSKTTSKTKPKTTSKTKPKDPPKKPKKKPKWLKELNEDAKWHQKRPLKRKSVEQAKKENKQAEKRVKARKRKEKEERERKKKEAETERLRKEKEKKRKKKKRDKTGSKKKSNNKDAPIVLNKVTIQQQDEDQRNRPHYKKLDDELQRKVDSMIEKLKQHNLKSDEVGIIKHLDDSMDVLLSNYAADLGKFSVKDRNQHRGKVERKLDKAKEILKEVEERQEKNDKLRDKCYAQDTPYIAKISQVVKLVDSKSKHLTKPEQTALQNVKEQITMLEIQYETGRRKYTFFDAEERDKELTRLVNLVTNKLYPMAQRLKAKK